MELGEFIKETLMQIVEGVTSAQEAVIESGAKINPDKELRSNTNGALLHNMKYIDIVEFSVALTDSSSNSGKAGVGVWFGGVGVGVEGKKDNKNESTTSIKFTVPLELPKM